MGALRGFKRKNSFFTNYNSMLKEKLTQQEIDYLKKQKVFLYKGIEKPHAICQFHIKEVGDKLAAQLDKTDIDKLKLVEAKLERIGKTNLPCEVCETEFKGGM